jgi:hypothetical protein
MALNDGKLFPAELAQKFLLFQLFHLLVVLPHRFHHVRLRRVLLPLLPFFFESL